MALKGCCLPKLICKLTNLNLTPSYIKSEEKQDPELKVSVAIPQVMKLGILVASILVGRYREGAV